MRLISAIAMCLSLTAFAANAGDSMRAREIEETFRGITLEGIYNNGAFYTETYFDDGSIRYRDIFGADTGDWSVRGNMFCTFYQGQQGACFFVFREGANCFTFHEPVRGADGHLVPSDSWTSRGWNTQEAVSCIEPPEVAV